MSYEFISGAEAVVRASLHGGCNFFAGYPISPSTEIHLKMMKELPSHNGIAIQGEDEIASISMCIAASMAGKKSMTVTSGPGMSLYSENIGLAIMGEVPLVIINVQRLGPATGGATTGAEGDILFSQWGTSGGMPIPVLSPSSIESVFYNVVHGFNISETLRTPVIILTSKDMMMTKYTIDIENIVYPEIKNRKYFEGTNNFIPYHIEKLHDIPEFLPIGSSQSVRFTTSMHDEEGYLTKVSQNTEKKLSHLEEKIIKNENRINRTILQKTNNSKTLIICYGINTAPCLEAVEVLNKEDVPCSMLTIESLFPLPEEDIKAALNEIKKVVIPELNNGQYAREIKPFIDSKIDFISLKKYNGELFRVEEVINGVKG